MPDIDLEKIPENTRDHTQRLFLFLKGYALFSLPLILPVIGIGCAHEYGSRAPASSFSKAELSRTDLRVGEIPGKNQVTATSQYHFSMAQAYSAEGNPDRAIEEYKLALLYDSDGAVIYARLASEYIRKGMLSAAMETCKEALTKDPSYTDARLILAGLYSSTQEYEEAVEQYGLVLKYDPENEEAAVYQAQSMMMLEQAPKAIQNLKAFLKRNPDSAVAWYFIARAQQEGQNYAEAEKSYLKALEARSHFTQAYLSLGLLFEETGKTKKAIRVYLEAYEDTQDTTISNRLATIYLKQEKYKEAIPYLESIEANDPSDLNARVKLGLVYMETKNYDSATRIFKGLIQENPDSDRVRFYLGSLYEEVGKLDEAVAELKQVPASSKLYSDAILHASRILLSQNRSVEAKKMLAQSIQESPYEASFPLFLASIHEDEGSLDQAIDVLEKARSYSPENERILYFMGSLYDRQGKTDMAIAKMEQVLFLNAESVDALNFLGYTWSTQRVKLDLAGKYLEQAMKLKPDNAYITDSWGWHLYLNGDIKKAVIYLEKAVQLKGDEPVILEHLADAYARLNLQEKALSTYERALSFSKEDKLKATLAQKVESMRTLLVQSGRRAAVGSSTSSSVSRSPASTK